MEKVRIWIIEKLLGGYSDIDSAISAIREKDLQEKYKILTLAVKKLFNALTADDILKENANGQWLFRGKTISDGEKKLLIAEATNFTDTKLWQILQDDVRWKSNEMMYLKSKSELDITVGKLWIFTLDAFKTRLNSMSKGSGIFNNKK